MRYTFEEVVQAAKGCGWRVTKEATEWIFEHRKRRKTVRFRDSPESERDVEYLIDALWAVYLILPTGDIDNEES